MAPQRARLAMALHGRNSHYAIQEIQRRHWFAQGQRIGFPPGDVGSMLDEAVSQTSRAIDAAASALPPEFPMDLADAIFDGMRRQQRRLAA
ncbi:hypothetical protein D3C81_1458130 [compost metagenome]